jgi:HTH-type transcriptional regulator/antitoxin HigA
MKDLRPIRTEADYEKALAEVERLWGHGLAHQTVTVSTSWPLSLMSMRPNTIRWTRRTRLKRSSFVWGNRGSRKDLEEILGSRAHVAEVLNRPCMRS